jgi:hypothetical protein
VASARLGAGVAGVSVRVEYDHISLKGPYPRDVRVVPQAPRAGESVTVDGDVFVVYNVHWWEQPVTDGGPEARIVLRTPEQYRRLSAGRG